MSKDNIKRLSLDEYYGDMCKRGINKRNKIVHIHIPKTGGSSLRKYLKSHGSTHSICSIFDKYHPHLRTENYKFITIIRNPYSRLISLYFFNINNPDVPAHKFLRSFGSFKKFVHQLKNIKILDIFETLKVAKDKNLNRKELHKYYLEEKVLPHNFKSQYTWFDGKIDVIMRLEQLNQDLKQLDFLKVTDKKVSKKNTSSHGRWQTYYDQELADVVYDVYKGDFEQLNYDKDSWKN